jgi:3-hydroxyisobutyrate dehydrogenase-like beta-hydroxyacid dehydrogenase
MQTRVALIGAGNMGGRMGRRLLAAGHPLAVCDPSRELVEVLVAGGAVAAANPGEAARDAELVILSLPTPAIVEAVVGGEDGILRTARPGTIVVDMSTGDPGTARRVEAACRAAGVNFLDAPVSRGTAGAEQGTLLIMVGGDAEVLEAARPVLARLGSDILLVGGPGSGQVAKLCNNMLAAINMQALGEVLVTGVKAGVDLETLAGVLTGGTGGSWVLSNQLPRTIFAGNDATTFALDLMHKDVWLFMRAAEELGLATPLAATAAQTLRIAKAEGFGPRDYSAIVRYFEKLADMELVPGKEAAL